MKKSDSQLIDKLIESSDSGIVMLPENDTYATIDIIQLNGGFNLIYKCPEGAYSVSFAPSIQDGLIQLAEVLSTPKEQWFTGEARSKKDMEELINLCTNRKKG